MVLLHTIQQGGMNRVCVWLSVIEELGSSGICGNFQGSRDCDSYLEHVEEVKKNEKRTFVGILRRLVAFHS